MSNTKMFQILLANIPDKFHYTNFNGLRILIYRSNDILVIWKKNNILLSKLSLTIGQEAHFNVLAIQNEVRDVFQVDTNVCCLDCKGTLYLLGDSEKRRLSTSDCEDLFQSDQESDEDQQSNITDMTFCPIFELKETICIQPIQHGFVLVKKNAEKLYVERFSSSKDMKSIKMISSMELCYDAGKAISCVTASYSIKSFLPALIGKLVKDLTFISGEVVFISVGKGHVYYIPVSEKTSAVYHPKLLYSSVEHVAGILCLPDINATSEVYSHIAVVLRSGPMVVISCDPAKKSLCYEITYLPGQAVALCGVGGNILAGDGIDLWQCKLRRNEENDLSLEMRKIEVMGVYLMCAIHGTDVVVAATVHGTFYTVHTSDVSQSSITQLVGNELTSGVMIPLTRYLHQLSSLKQEISREEELLSALSIVLRSKLLKDAFHMTAKVHRLNNIYSDQEVLQVLIEGDEDFEDKISDSKFKCRYLLKLHIENSSEQEFSPSLWSLCVSVSTSDEVIKKCVKLKSTFKKDSPLHMSLSTNIREPCLGVDVHCTLVCELPNDENECHEGSPWLTIPIAPTHLDAAYFFNPSIMIDKKMCADSMSYETLLSTVHRNNCSENVAAGKEPAVCQTDDKSKEHSYTLKLPNGVIINELWSEIFKHCLHQCSKEIKELCNASSTTERDVYVYVGFLHVVLSLLASEVKLQGPDARTLHAVKCVVLSSVTTLVGATSGTVHLEGSIISKALEVRDKIEVEKSLSNIDAMKIYKKEWRNCVSENIPL